MNPKVAQLMLPAVEKLGQSPKPSFQLSRMHTAAEAAESPWQKMMQAIPKGEASPGFTMRPERIQGGRPLGMKFDLSEPGRSKWSGSATYDRANPFELYVEGLHSAGSRRAGIGNVEQGLAHYTMDITSPAQRELPLKGMKLPANEKAERMAISRTPEERHPMGRRGWDMLPSPSTTGKQLGIDRMLDLARRSGFKKLGFSAEPGERPRLYEKLTGYKANMEGDEDIVSMLGRMTGRAPEAAASATPRQRLAQPGATLSPQTLEQMLGLSIDEAVEFGLARRLGTSNSHFQLTDEGRRSAAEWIGG